jgi:hypothetical protein
MTQYSSGAVYGALVNAGFSPTTARNLTAVWHVETGGRFDTGSYGFQPTEHPGVLSSGGAYGLAQWNASRQADLANFASSRGLAPDSLQAQAGFAYQEFNQKGLDPQNSSIETIVNRYEIPRNKQAEISASYDRLGKINATGASTGAINPREPSLEPGPIGGFRPEHLTKDVATGEEYLYGPPPISGAFGVSDKELNAITNYYSPVQHSQADAWQDYQQDVRAGDAPSRADLGLPGGAVGAGKGISGDVGDIKPGESQTYLRQMTPEEEAAMPGPAGQAGIGGGTGQQPGGESPFGGAPGGGSGEQSGGSSGAASSDSTAGNPIYVTNPSVIAVKAGEQVKKGAEQMGKDVKESGKKLGEDVTKTGQALDQQIDSSTGQVTSTAKSITQYVGDLVYHVFPRITVGVGALILVLIGLWMLGSEPKVLQKVT